MKKITEEYKNSLLKPIHKGFQNGMRVKQLAKKFSISKEMVSKIDYRYREIEYQIKKTCHKKYALFYCEDEPEVMSCQWVGNRD